MTEEGCAIDYVLPLLTAFTVVFALVPYVRKFALNKGFVDRPSQRKIHAAPVPLMGGVAIYAGTIISMLFFAGFTPLTYAVMVGGSILVAIGMADDWHKSKGKDFAVWPRVVVYLIAATVPLWFGIKIIGITSIAYPGMMFFPTWFVWLATVLWVFSLTNMMNFIDGVDGLATGIATLSSFTLFVAAIIKGQTGTALLAAILVGATVAFLSYNFHPAKIFMGDAGATFLGYTLAVLSVDGAFKSATFLSVLIPIFAFGVPIMDTVIVFSRRIIEKKGLHRADKLHTHHSLMKWGLSQTQTVSFLYLIGALFSLISIILMLTVS
jgi:UDP-GlcNAc:undecaprenyl-phosphate GlcNAc-1-phosphate transferase